ncbi:MAG: replication initiator protein A [Planctomycetota bacterium]|nr:MAG: replication initiator protein A [Planctomycetota bacterium]
MLSGLRSVKKDPRGDAEWLETESAEGRDELNLAEFPLAALADRVPNDQKTLVFEDTVWDRQARQRVVRRLTISASDRYGLPTALDDEVILGLVQLTRQAHFADRHVAFSRYELINLLAWRQEGKSYRRLDQSLRRWLGVTLYYDKAWWDKQANCWIDAAFHLLDQITLARRPKGARPGAAAADRENRSTFTWNEVVFRSFRAGYLKRLDMDLYRSLESTIAKRMLRFLDKRFYHRARWEFPLVEFACEHIGLGRNYDTGQLKRRLAPAIAELEAAGVIGRLTDAARYRRVARSDWRVVFTKGRRRGRTPHQDAASAPIVDELVQRGVSPRMARRLAAESTQEAIAAKIAVFDELLHAGDTRVSRNPAGYLVESIRNDYAQPALPKRHRAPDQHVRRVRAARPSIAPTTATDEPGVDADEERVQAYLAGLSAAERMAVEHDAERAASPLLQHGLREAIETGVEPAREAYRTVIVRQHVLRLLSQPANMTKP